MILVKIILGVIRKWSSEAALAMTDTDKFWSEKPTWAFGSGELKVSQGLQTERG